MSTSLIQSPRARFWGNDGVPLALGLVYTYSAGSSTPKATYSDSAGLIANANPIVLDSKGEAVIYGAGSYKIDLKTTLGVQVTGFPVDNVVIDGSGTVTTNLAASGGSALVGFIQSGTGAVARTVQDKNREVFSPADYGAIGNSDGTAGVGTDDSVAWRALGVALAARGGGVVRGAGLRYRVMSASTAALFDLTSCRDVYFEHCELVIDRTFTVGQIYQLFQFTACAGIRGSLKISCTYAGAGAAKYDRGFEAFKFLQGCRDVDLVIDAVQIRSAAMFRRESTDPVTYSSRGIRLMINATSVGYPLSCILAGDDLQAKIVCDACTRAYYPYGVSNHTVNVRSKNHEGSADCLITTAVGLGNDTVNLTYVDTESTTTDGSIGAVRVEFGDQTAAIQRNIKTNIYIKLAAGKYVGKPLMVAKLTNAGAADTVDRGHILENFDFDVCLTSTTGSQPSIDFCATGTWSTGEFLRNITGKFRTDGAGQPTFNFASLADIATLSGYSSATVNVTGGTGLANFINSNVSAWSYTGKVAFDGGLRGSATLDPGNLAGGANQTSSVTVTGAAIGDMADASFSQVDLGMDWTAEVTSANTVTVRQSNRTGGAIDQASGTVKVAVWKQT